MPVSRPAARAATLLGAVILSTVIAQTVQDGALGPLMTTALAARGVDATLSGVVVAAPWLTVALFSPLAAKLFRKFGPAPSMALGGMLSIVCFALFPLFDGVGAWLVISLAIGFGMALRWVTGEAWLIALTPQRLMGRVIGLQETLIGVAAMLGPLILVATGTAGAAPFLACAGIMALGTLLPLWVGEQDTAPPPPDPEPMSDERRAGALRLAFLTATAGGAIEIGGHAFLPTTVAASELFGLSPVLAASLFSLGGTVFQYPFGLLVDRRGSRIMAAGLVLAGAGLAAAMATAALLPAIFVTGAVAGTFYTLGALIVAQALPAAAVPGAIARLAIGNTVGGILGPLAMGVAIDLFGARGLGIVIAVIGLVALAAITTVRRGGAAREVVPDPPD